MKRLAALFLAALFLLTGCSSQKQEKEQEPVKYEYLCWDVFDTVTTVQGYAPSQEVWDQAMEVFHDTLLEYHRLYDIYNEYPDLVNLATLNRMAGQGPVEVDDKIISLLTLSKEVYDLTGGRTNVAAGAVLRLWHDARTLGLEDPEQAALPDQAALEEGALHCNMDDLILDSQAGTVELADPEMSLDVGSIGKGYATEMAARAAVEAGVTSAYFNVGGNSRTVGYKPDGSSWAAGLETPWKGDESLPAYLDALNISDLSLVVSGDYQRYYTVDGEKYHHLIDLETLYPAQYASSVAVICADSGLADGLSTGLFCMSPEEGLELVESLEGVEAKWLFPDRTSQESSGWKNYQA